jgi:hypothetical protein
MRGYISVVDGNAGGIRVEDRVEIYRDPGDTQEIRARTASGEQGLGISDATVSRLKDGTPPIVLEAHQSCIEVRNRRNSNGVTVNRESTTTTLGTGRTERVTETAVLSVGHHTTFRLTVKQEAQTEINVEGGVKGDVVAGDQVDRSTNVVDSVVNRSDISGDGGGASVEDSVVNRSRVGSEGSTDEGTETKNRCPVHEILYEGETCPECASTGRVEAGHSETKFCMFCGSEIPAAATACPECDGEFPSTS